MVAISDGAAPSLPESKPKPVYIVLQLEGGIAQWLWAKSEKEEAVELAQKIVREGGFDPEDDEVIVVKTIPDKETYNIIWAWPE